MVGRAAETGVHVFHAADMKRFAAKFDPQPFHVDEAAAAASLLGGLCASGWHTAAVSMRLGVDFRRREALRWRKAGQGEPKVGPSPEITNLKWPKPVFAGDTVRFVQTITGKRFSATRPGWGLVGSSRTGVNQHGATVIAYDAAVFIRTR